MFAPIRGASRPCSLCAAPLAMLSNSVCPSAVNPFFLAGRQASEELVKALGGGRGVRYGLYDAFLLVDVVAGVLRRYLGVGSTLTPGNDVDRVRHRASVPEEYGFHRVQAFCDALSYLVGVNPMA